jgi:predicted GIY-YIG superfamily endonuclease
MTTLYRLWNADHALLYVGITDDVNARMDEHRAEKPWWEEVSQVSTEELSSRRRALEAETRAIYWEQPRYNVLGSPRYSADWEARYHALEDVEARRCALPTLSEDDFKAISTAMITLTEAGFREEALILFDSLDKLYERSRPLSSLESAGVVRP